uniref:Uncharacterized protein n=1 Tax=Anguilla anguilla TaxID=7936 RepID=A0A0E9PXB1_ANGAN
MRPRLCGTLLHNATSPPLLPSPLLPHSPFPPSPPSLSVETHTHQSISKFPNPPHRTF